MPTPGAQLYYTDRDETYRDPATGDTIISCTRLDDFATLKSLWHAQRWLKRIPLP